MSFRKTQTRIQKEKVVFFKMHLLFNDALSFSISLINLF